MALSIPQEDIEALYTFSQYSVEIKNQVYLVLKELKLGDTPKKIAKNISKELGLDFGELFSALLVYFTLLRTLYNSTKTDEEIIEELNNNIIELDFDFDAEDLKMIQDTVLAFIRIKNDVPLITALAYDTATLSSKLYLSSKIIQDLRPIFFNDQIAGLAFYHTIRFHYESEDKSHHNFFLNFDLEDIEDLSSQLEEAKVRIQGVKEKFGDLIIQI